MLPDRMTPDRCQMLDCTRPGTRTRVEDIAVPPYQTTMRYCPTHDHEISAAEREQQTERERIVDAWLASIFGEEGHPVT